MRTNLEMLERTEDLTRFMELRKRIHKLGTEDYYARMNIIFRHNYMEILEKYKSYDNYDKLVKKLNSIKKPEDFYDVIKSSALGMDLFLFYDEYQTQQEFNKFAQDLGVTDSELIDSSSL